MFVFTCAWMCTERPKVAIPCLLLMPSLSFFETISLSHWFQNSLTRQTDWLAHSGDPQVFTSAQHYAYKCKSTHLLLHGRWDLNSDLHVYMVMGNLCQPIIFKRWDKFKAWLSGTWRRTLHSSGALSLVPLQHNWAWTFCSCFMSLPLIINKNIIVLSFS